MNIFIHFYQSDCNLLKLLFPFALLFTVYSQICPEQVPMYHPLKKYQNIKVKKSMK